MGKNIAFCLVFILIHEQKYKKERPIYEILDMDKIQKWLHLPVVSNPVILND